MKNLQKISFNYHQLSSNTHLICSPAAGFPPPELTWYMRPKNTGDNTRVQLNDNQRYDISKQIQTSVLRFGESWYTLRIKNVVANDFTEYWCVATNRIGSNDTTMIKLYRKYMYLH